MQESVRRSPRIGLAAACVLIVMLLASTGCMHVLLAGRGPKVPPPSAFGLDARPSVGGAYMVALESDGLLTKGRMQRVRVRVADATGAAVDGATVTVDGGMPQHRHGLPTRPRVIGRGADGAYDVDGLRFSMGGWWELRFRISTPQATDSVTFNIRL